MLPEMKQIGNIVAGCALALAAAACAQQPTLSPEAVARVREFIRTSWDTSVQYSPADSQTLIGLPHPYTVPSVSETFQELYYWDTYFTNEGLVRDGRIDLAKNNTDNMLYLVERFGYMPNGSRTWYLNRSQPPFLCMMVDRVFGQTGDTEWLAQAFATLQKEYAFWMTQRITPVGLNRYSSSAGDELKQEFVTTGGQRLGTDFRSRGLSEAELLQTGAHLAAEAESGWDFNPRFERRCEDFCPVDLNANLYLYETLFARYAALLGDADAAQEWKACAARRRALLDRYCLGEDGIYYDYDYVNGRRSSVISGAVFSLLYAGVPDPSQARRLVDGALGRLEFEYGVAACEDKPYDYAYQWSYPNAWPPITYLAIRGLDTYGFKHEARRIAGKYAATVVRTFEQTHNLWEKYNVREGNINVSNEYGMPTMLGWSAGTFVYACDYLDGKIDNQAKQLKPRNHE